MCSIGSGVRMPATTSSPCALTRNSPYRRRSPVDGSRVKQTPVPGRVPLVAEHHLDDVDGGAEVVGDVVRAAVDAGARRLPRVEHGAGRAAQLLPCVRGERRRRPRARRAPGRSRSAPRRSSAVSSTSRRAPRASLSACSSPSKTCASIPSTTSPYIWIRRRYESNANRGLPVAVASPSTATSLSPRLRIVSIIPGIETAAPERTETRSGSPASPKRFPVFSSSRATCSSTSGQSASGTSPACIVCAARVGRDREAGRNRDPERGHLREPDALAAEQLPPARGLLVECVDQAHGAILRTVRDSVAH